MAVSTPQQEQPLTEKEQRRFIRSQRRSRWDVKFSPYLYISPFFILFLLTGLFPLVYTAWVSVHDWTLIGGQVCGGDTVGELVNLIAAMIQAEMSADQIATFQMGTHPLLTASPIAYQLVNAAEIALGKMRTT